MRRWLSVVVFGLAVGVGIVLGWRVLGRPRVSPADAAGVVSQVREVARLETLEVTLWKKVSFAPEPEPADSFWGDVGKWVRFSLRNPKGRAIVFADAHLKLDLTRFDHNNLLVSGGNIYLVLPPVIATVELRPADTEIIASNLDSKETAELFELARLAFVRQLEADTALVARARASAERALKAALLRRERPP